MNSSRFTQTLADCTHTKLVRIKDIIIVYIVQDINVEYTVLEGSCCRRLQKKIMEQKENINILTAKLSKSEQVQRLTVTSNPYNKQVTYLDRALNEAKEKVRNLG